MNSPTKLTIKAGFIYFALVFAAGFILGPIRVLWAVPQFGERTAELLEMPLMLGAIILAARWTMGHFSVPDTLRLRLQSGLTALTCLVITEILLVLNLWGMPLGDYITSRDPVSGTAYLIMLALFAVMPALVARKEEKEASENGTI